MPPPTDEVMHDAVGRDERDGLEAASGMAQVPGLSAGRPTTTD
jgi:hypothetical protein